MPGDGEILARLGQKKVAHVLHYLKRMCIHGINMKQVVLHLSGHPAKLGQVETENAIAPQAPQLFTQTFRVIKKLDKQLVVSGVAAKVIINQMAAFSQQADGGGAHAFDIPVLRYKHKNLQQSGGGFFEYVNMGGFNITVALLKALVDGAHTFFQASLQNGFLQKLQQHIVEFTQGHNQPKVLMHKLLDSESLLGVFIAEQFGQLALMIK